jgi:hypothetical protein
MATVALGCFVGSNATKEDDTMGPSGLFPARASVYATACGLTALAGYGCAPVFSDFQSAKLAGRGGVEMTPSYSSVWTSGGDGGHVQDEYGSQAATGLTDRLDLRLRYVHTEGVNIAGFGPKIGLVKDRVAVAIPVGFAFGNGVRTNDTWAVHPTLVLTGPIDSHAEMNVSTKVLIPLSSNGGDTLVALNIGAGLGHLKRWAIRPEVGVLFDPHKHGQYIQAGIGLTVFAGRRVQAAQH